MPLIGQFRLLDTISLPLISPLDFSTLSLLFFKKNEREYRYDERNYGNYGERELKKVGLSIRARTFKVERRIDRGGGGENLVGTRNAEIGRAFDATKPVVYR